ncbi:DUF4465 domain-containing protein [Allorhodopirellula solitaria]|uniref:Calx-beta domain protein n=1 Tax=Allorhodopirellula solitaria TaxID=2527987 RepID=A0A5C5YKL8_9BACT|nr:DUF4465 domain-containing protein [Allorhodopirellula solitaria]TWT75416.1 Calx-beta domain protein [Allorhodopirellula solitaria]
MNYKQSRQIARRRIGRRLLVESLEGRRLLAAGPYAPAAGQPDSTAISNDDPAFVGWATAVADYTPDSDVDDVWTDASEATGPAEGNYDSIVSLGRGGSLTLTFDTPIRDGLGADFAVFENSINDTFLELGFVEVSSDGVNYFRFDSDSQTPSAVSSFGAVDPTNIHNLAGKYRRGYGTPFDLAELRGEAGLDVTSIQYVRLVDIVGDGLTNDASGDPIYDPTPTFQSAGLDVDGVGVIHAAETADAIVDLETLGSGLGGSSFDNGANAGGEFSEEEILLNNNYSSQYQSWAGWSISQTTDTTTAGYTNQYSNITGGGVDDSDTYAVGFFDPSPNGALPAPALTLDPVSGSRFDSLYVTNTTYAVLSMREGDGFAKKFGGVSGDDPDFLRLTITGLDATGSAVGDVSVMLADYRPTDNSEDFILDAWTRVDVSSLADARSLQFTMESSDNSPFGMNTPAYFAVDNVALQRPLVPLDLSSPTTVEDSSVVGRVSRPTLDTSAPVTVAIESTGSDEVTLPASVTIPAGEDYAEFQIAPANDAIPTPDREVQITASADLMLPSTRSLVIQDDEVLSITFTPSTINATEGDGPSGATLTLTRNDADISTPLAVTLSHDATELLTIPTTVTFAATQREVTIPINVLDDEIAGDGQTIAVRAEAEGRAPAELTIELADDDLPALRMAPTTVSVSEEEPATTRTVQIYRNTADLSNAVTVALALPDGAPLTIPAEVTIPENMDSVSFDIGVVDDSLVNELPVYRIAASRAGFLSASLDVQVTDNDGPPPGLTVSAPETGLSESDAVFVSDFESLGSGLLTGEFDNSAGASGAFGDGVLEFENTFDNSFGFDVWSGFAISRGTDSQTPGFGNQYSSLAGGGADGSSTYAIAYAGSPAVVSRENTTANFSTIDVTNTTYTGLSMRDGDDFAKKFGGESGDDPDFLLLTIDGLDENGESIGEVQVYLADYRFENNDLDYILEDWTTIDVGGIGHAETLSMQLTSSDNGDFGMNTPAYLAVDNVLMEPETSSLPTITVARTGGDTSSPVEVSLTDDRNEMRLPPQVTIPAGATEVSVPVQWLDDAIAQGDRIWQVDASADGFTSASESIVLRDDDEPALSITPSAEQLNESAGQQTIGFEDVGGSLDDESFNNGADGRGGFASGSLEFSTAYDPTFGSWSGWSASNVTDVATAGFGNQFSAFAGIGDEVPGGGANESATYAVAGGYGSSPLTIALPDGFEGASFGSIDITNTTYTALSMLQGDAFAKQFGGESGDDPDYFLLTIDGVNDVGETVDSIDFYLADYRFDDNSLDYVVADWTTVDLTSLTGATSLQFSMSSSDVGDFGMNTPAFFAIDELVIDRDADASPSLVVARNSADLSEAVTVTLDADPTTSLSAPPSVVIPAGADRVRVPLSLVDDAVYHGDETATFTASAEDFASSATSIDVLEDELPRIVLGGAEANIPLAEGGDSQSFTVKLPSAPTGPVTISITGGDGALDVAPAELTFGPENWDQPQTVTVAGRLDLLAEADQVIRLGVSDGSTDYARADAWIQLADYQPEHLTLEVDGDAVQLIDDDRGYVFGQYTDDDPIAFALSDLAQRLTLEPLGRSDATVSLGGGDDTLQLHSAAFDEINGGVGYDGAVIAPTDLEDGASIDVADWLTQRLIGFEDIVLGSAAVGSDTSAIPFTLDADQMQAVFDGDSPRVSTAADQNWDLIGEWQIGEPTIEGGVFTGRMVSGDAEVWVATDHPYQNFVDYADVNADGIVTSVDALTIINRINADPEFILPPPTSPDDFDGFYYDVSGDNFVTSLDALQVINWLNSQDTAGVSDDDPPQASPQTSRASGEDVNMAELARRDGDDSDTDVESEPEMVITVEETALPAATTWTSPASIAPQRATNRDSKTIDPAAVDAVIGDLELLSASTDLAVSERLA